MTGRLSQVPLGDNEVYFAEKNPDRTTERARHFPEISEQANVRDCILGPWTRVGARTSLHEVSMGAYSYIVTDSSATYSSIGKFCSIARDVRINPGNHPMWRAAQHHFTYRSVSYDMGEDDDSPFFEWRRDDHCTIGHDVWVGHGATILAGVSVGAGSVIGAGAVVSKDVAPYTIVGGVPATPIRLRFPTEIQEGLLALAWWDWDHERLDQALPDFRALDAEAFITKYG